MAFGPADVGGAQPTGLRNANADFDAPVEEWAKLQNDRRGQRLGISAPSLGGVATPAKSPDPKRRCSVASAVVVLCKLLLEAPIHAAR